MIRSLAWALGGGWLHTGDLGAVDEAGFVTLRDRSKDLIISGGSNVYPREVKEVLIKHPFVREVSVIGRPDPDWGETVIAYVVGAASSEPKNSYGKILKSELRARDRTSTVASVPSRGADS